MTPAQRDAMHQGIKSEHRQLTLAQMEDRFVRGMISSDDREHWLYHWQNSAYRFGTTYSTYALNGKPCPVCGATFEAVAK